MPMAQLWGEKVLVRVLMGVLSGEITREDIQLGDPGVDFVTRANLQHEKWRAVPRSHLINAFRPFQMEELLIGRE
jgi:hypothetical protein